MEILMTTLKFTGLHLIFCCVCLIFSSTLSAQVMHCSNKKFILNLGYPENKLDSSLTEMIEKLANEAEEDSYKLSMALVAAALEGNKSLYKQILPKLIKALNLTTAYSQVDIESKALYNHISEFSKNTKKPHSYVGWLLGRILFAAIAVQDYHTAEKTAPIMLFVLEDKDTPQDEFTAWAWGYFTMYFACDPNYAIFKDKMRQNVAKLVKKSSNPADVINALWALLLEIQSAAIAQDRLSYDKIIQEMKDLTNKHDVIQALSVIPVDDYRAWALSQLRLAAVRVGDSSLFIRLSAPLRINIAEASSNNKALAILNNLISLKQIEFESQAQE